MKISDAGINFIKGFEGLKLKAYRDVAGVWTIGYGTTSGVKKDMTITKDEAEELLRKDVAKFESGVSKLVKVPLSQNEYDALVSFAYNVGLGALGNSSLLLELNAGHREHAANQFLRWDKATIGGKKVPVKGLTIRRKNERAVFLGRGDGTP